MRALFLLFASLLCHTVFAATLHEVYYQGDLTPLNITPTFDKGYLFVYDSQKIDVYAPDGWPVGSISAQVPDARVALIQNAAADTDGRMAGAIEYYRDKTSRTAGGGVAVFDRSGKQVRFFDTGRYLPTQVCFGPDHSIWALGWQGPSDQDNDYFVLRNYLQDGQELGAFLLRSSFEPEPDPVGPMIGRWQLRIMGGRVGALFYESMIVKEGQNSRLARQWIETDLKGRALGRWDISGDRSPEAFTQSGTLYKHEGDAVLVFDRTAKAWRQVATVPNGILLGADGDSLVFEMRGTSTLRWMLVSQ